MSDTTNSDSVTAPEAPKFSAAQIAHLRKVGTLNSKGALVISADALAALSVTRARSDSADRVAQLRAALADPRSVTADDGSVWVPSIALNDAGFGTTYCTGPNMWSGLQSGADAAYEIGLTSRWAPKVDADFSTKPGVRFTAVTAEDRVKRAKLEAKRAPVVAPPPATGTEPAEPPADSTPAGGDSAEGAAPVVE